MEDSMRSPARAMLNCKLTDAVMNSCKHSHAKKDFLGLEKGSFLMAYIKTKALATFHKGIPKASGKTAKGAIRIPKKIP